MNGIYGEKMARIGLRYHCMHACIISVDGV